MIKVLHVLPNYFPRLGGIETLMSQYFKMQTDDSQFEHSILTLKRQNQSSVKRTRGVTQIDEINIPDLQNSHDILQPTLRIISQLRRVIIERQPSVIHLHAIHELSLFTVKIARELDIPLIYHFHGTVTNEDMKVLKPVLPFLQNILVVSQATLLSLLPYVSGNSQIQVIVNGVEDTGGILNTKAQNIEPKLLIAGRIEREKGFDVAVVALGLIVKEMPSVRLVVIGSGSQKEHLQALAAELGILKSVDFLGALENEDVIREIDQSSIVLVPSRGIEGFGIVAVEAALREVAVIASDIGGLSHTVEHGKSGFLVPAEDPTAIAERVKELLHDPDYLVIIGKYSRVRALDLFGCERFKTELEDYYFNIKAGKEFDDYT